MKYLFIALALATGIPGGRAQSLDQWFHQKKTRTRQLAQQLVAWKAYGDCLRQGYALLSQGLADLGRLSGENYQLQAQYFSSLRQPGHGSPAGTEAEDLATEVARTKDQVSAFLHAHPEPRQGINPAARAAINQLWAEAQHTRAAYRTLQAPGLQMTPSQRWTSQHHLMLQLRNICTRARQLAATLWRLHASAGRERQDIHLLRALQIHKP